MELQKWFIKKKNSNQNSTISNNNYSKNNEEGKNAINILNSLIKFNTLNSFKSKGKNNHEIQNSDFYLRHNSIYPNYCLSNSSKGNNRTN